MSGREVALINGLPVKSRFPSEIDKRKEWREGRFRGGEEGLSRGGAENSPTYHKGEITAVDRTDGRRG